MAHLLHPAPPETPSRRRLLAVSAALALPGCASTTIAEATKTEKPSDDTALLLNLMGLENSAISGYEAVLAGALLDEDDRTLAAAFVADHRRHAAALKRALDRIGGLLPPAPDSSHLPPPSLADRKDAVGFLSGLEQGLALAHLGAVPAYVGKDLAKGAAGILGIESMHWAVWRRALGEPPVPEPILG